MSHTKKKNKTGPLTITEAAALLGVHTNTLKRLPPSEIPYFTINNRGDRRYHRSSIQRYIEWRTVRE